MLWSLLATLFLELLLLPAPFHTPRPQPRPALTIAEQGEDKHLPKSLSAPNNIFLPPQGRRAMNNSFICKSVKKITLTPRAIYYSYEWRKTEANSSQMNSEGEKQHATFSMAQQLLLHAYPD